MIVFAFVVLGLVLAAVWLAPKGEHYRDTPPQFTVTSMDEEEWIDMVLGIDTSEARRKRDSHGPRT